MMSSNLKESKLLLELFSLYKLLIIFNTFFIYSCIVMQSFNEKVELIDKSLEFGSRFI
jgi:hypothetical protein